MDWTKTYITTIVPQVPKIMNDNFQAVENYINVFYDGSSGVLLKPVNTTGRIKGTTGEFVNVVVDNLTVKNQYTNLYDNITTADYQYYDMVVNDNTILRDPCTDATYWPYENYSGYKVIDVNQPYYKITNEFPLFLKNENLSQVVGLHLDSSLVGSDYFTILMDPCAGTTYSVEYSQAGKAYIELIAIDYDASWGTTWAPYRYEVEDASGAKAPLNINFTTKESNYTVSSYDNNYIVDASGTMTVTLPDNLSTGFQVTIVNAGPGVVTLDASNLLTADGNTQLATQYAGASAAHKGNGTWYAWGNLE